MIIQRILDKLNGNLSCGEVLELLQGYLDGVIDEAEARKVAEHLKRCGHCDSEADVYRKLKATLASRTRPVDPVVLASLHDFGRRLFNDSSET